MPTLMVRSETFPIAGAFTISRGSKTEAEVISVTIRDGEHVGRGECVPYARYGETMDSVRQELESARQIISAGASRAELGLQMHPGAARNALDCALWDLEAKRLGRTAADFLGMTEVQPLKTAYTLSLGDPEAMHAQARENAWRPLLKVKVGTDRDEARMRAVATGAPDSRIILDANEGWSHENIVANLALAAELGITLIEQPLKAGHDMMLRDIFHAVPLCADESVHVADDLERLVGLYDAVNIKLDKAGGLTAGLQLRDKARAIGFQIMVGCMVGTSLGMAPAILLAQGAEFVDLDGPLLLARDREPGLVYQGSTVLPPHRDLWG